MKKGNKNKKVKLNLEIIELEGKLAPTGGAGASGGFYNESTHEGAEC